MKVNTIFPKPSKKIKKVCRVQVNMLCVGESYIHTYIHCMPIDIHTNHYLRQNLCARPYIHIQLLLSTDFRNRRSWRNSPQLAKHLHIIHTYIHLITNTYKKKLVYVQHEIHIHTYIHTCMHTCIHACIHTYIRTNIHTFILYIKYIHTYIHTYK